MASRRRRANRTRDQEGFGSYSSPACYLHELENGPAPARTRGVAIKRIYDEPAPGDGYRVLIDRLWPRGMSRERATLDEWLKDLAPSAALRQWFHRDRERFAEFARRYRRELRAHDVELQALRRRTRQQRLTLLTAAREVRANHALVLRELLSRSVRSRR
jgi:uncharacterized protein YeaO (DUF488 family)